MSVAVIINRIGSALQLGALQVLPEPAAVEPVSTMAGLLRPWQEVYPGADPEDEHRDLFCWGGLRKPRFLPRPRTSRRPLPAPLRISPSPKLISPGLFDSVRGIWDFYGTIGKADPALLEQPLNNEGLYKFIADLEWHLSDYYPLPLYLEGLFSDGSVEHINCIPLCLPFWSFEDEGVGVVEAFLNGPSGVHSFLVYCSSNPESEYKNLEIELHPKDEALIAEVGYEKLLEVYAAFAGEKSFDLNALENFAETYFGEVGRKYPEHGSPDSYIIITDDCYHCEVPITCRQDIEFAIEYAEAFSRMCNALPDPSDMDSNHGGVTENFIHEICEAWRKTNGKRSVKWASPKSGRLSYLYKRGEL